jgi:lambda repressor-like predicted transcriptional regulator
VTYELSTTRVLSDHVLRNWHVLESLAEATERLLSEPEQGQPLLAILRRQDQKRLSSYEVVQVIQLYQAGAEMRALADQFGVHKHTVSQCLKRMGVPLRRQGLHDDDIVEAAQLYADGWSLVGLGEKYGCAHSSVRNALLRHGYQLRATTRVAILS